VKCETEVGAYYCGVCKFWDDQGPKKKTFHCDKCGICRVGGKDNFWHCDTCAMCYSPHMKNNHKCISNSFHQNCPVCLEFMFDSRKVTTKLKCGHSVHDACMRDMMRNGIHKCPTCSTRFADLSEHDRMMRQYVDMNTMPEEYKDAKANILCNECHETSEVALHFIAMACPHCHSFNTQRS